MVARVRAGEVRVDFTGRATEFQRAARSASSALRRQQRQLTLYQRAARAANVQNRLLNAGLAAFAAVASVQAVRGLARLSDQSRLLDGRLALVSDSAGEASNTFGLLTEVARTTSSSYENVINLFFRLRQSLSDNVASTDELIAVTQTLARTTTLSGASGEAASNALVQFGQGLAAGALRGEELNSVLEQLPALARAISQGIGVNVGDLRGLAEQGSLTSEVLFAALTRVAEDVEEEFSQLPRTIARALQELRNQFFDIFRITDQTSQSTLQVIEAIDSFAQTIRQNEEAIVNALGLMARAASNLISVLDTLLIVIGLFVGARVLGGVAAGVTSAVIGLRSLSTVARSTRDNLRGVRNGLDDAEESFYNFNQRIATGRLDRDRITMDLRQMNEAQDRTTVSITALGASMTALIGIITALGGSLGTAVLAVGGLTLAFISLRGVFTRINTDFRDLAAANAATTEALEERLAELQMLVEAETALGETALSFRTDELAVINQVLEQRRALAEATDVEARAYGGFSDALDAVQASADRAEIGVNRFIDSFREASIVAQNAELGAAQLDNFDEADPRRAALAARLQGEAEYTALVRQQFAIIKNGDEDQKRDARILLQLLALRRNVFLEIQKINEDTAASEQDRINRATRAGGALTADAFIRDIERDVAGAARRVTQASQLSQFDADDPARAALEARLGVLNRLEDRYLDLMFTIATAGGAEAIAAQGELDRLRMREQAVIDLANARGVEAAAAQAAANRTRDLAREQERTLRLSMQLATSFENAAETIIFDSGSARQAVARLADEILRAIVQALIIRPLIGGILGGIGIPFLQHGGFTGGGPAVVGENGPELVDFNQPARVYSNRDSRELFGNASRGGGQIVVNQIYNIESGVNEAMLQDALQLASPVIQQATLNQLQDQLGKPSPLRLAVNGR